MNSQLFQQGQLMNWKRWVNRKTTKFSDQQILNKIKDIWLKDRGIQSGVAIVLSFIKVRFFVTLYTMVDDVLTRTINVHTYIIDQTISYSQFLKEFYVAFFYFLGFLSMCWQVYCRVKTLDDMAKYDIFSQRITKSYST